MRGRLRAVFDNNIKADAEKSKTDESIEEESEVEKSNVDDAKTVDEIPDYGELNPYFSIKLHFDGKFKEECTAYEGEKIAYFDMCSVVGLNFTEIGAMLGELGCSSEKIDMWFLVNDSELSPQNLIPLETGTDLEMLMDLVESDYRMVKLYTRKNSPEFDNEAWDFSYTQMAIDDRVKRIEDIRVEVEANDNVEVEEAVEEEKLSFHGDSSNMDSSASECPRPKRKKRRIPPPNPPYRTRKVGRFSMLRGLFKNTESTPLVLDDNGQEVVPLPVSKVNKTKGKSSQDAVKSVCKKKGAASVGNVKKKVAAEVTSKLDDEDDFQKGNLGGATVGKGKKKGPASVGKLKKKVAAEVPSKHDDDDDFQKGNQGGATVGKGKKNIPASVGKLKKKVGAEVPSKHDDEDDFQKGNQGGATVGKGKIMVLAKFANFGKGKKKLDDFETVKKGESQLFLEHNQEQEKHEEEEKSETSYSDFDSSGERMAISSCDEDEIKFPEFNEHTDMEDPEFILGMLFSSGKVFREAVRKHAIKHQRGIRLKKNLADKIKWICVEGCDWKCYGIRQQRSNNIQIKTLNTKHTCNETWVQKQINSTWIVRTYEHEVRMNPSMPVAAFQAKVINDLKCNISSHMIYRALRKARETIIGRHDEEFQKLYEYANEVKKVMPSSTLKIMTEPTDSGFEGRRFKRFYVCLGPLKEGFLHGCRPLIGLDGCHLKGPFGGILLTVVGTDPNEGMYPIAWAQVEAENNNIWDWFLELLKDDLMIQNSGTYTFISDRRKGLVNALENHFPESEIRFCVMHLYNNMKKDFKGIGITSQMWLAAKSTTDYFFNINMEALKQLNMKAYEWLAAKPRSQWSRSGFRELCKSYVFVNNNCEIFNNAINKYRDNGIVTMFKGIHKACMIRIQQRKTKMEKKHIRYCSKIMKKMNKSIALAAKAFSVWNGGDKYHVTMSAGGHEVVVDLKKRTCACRKWQLTGIPCFHAVACINFQKMDPQDFVHECYTKEKYLDVYNHLLEPISGEQYWERTEQDIPLPPLRKIAPRRPKKCRDKKNDVVPTRENNANMMKRQGTSLRCSNCGEWEHNVRSCPTKATMEEEGVYKWEPKLPRCGYCKEEGHNSRSCSTKKLDIEKKKRQEQADEEELFKQDLQELQRAQTITCAQQKTPTTKKVAGLTARSIHGGIVKPFKAPAHAGPLGVEFFEINGENFTTLSQLQVAIRKKKGARENKNV